MRISTSFSSSSKWDDAESTHIVADRKSTRLNSSHVRISYAVFCLKKKKKKKKNSIHNNKKHKNKIDQYITNTRYNQNKPILYNIDNIKIHNNNSSRVIVVNTSYDI